MFLSPNTAHLALNIAAPHEAAVALLLHLLHTCIVSPAAAQQPTAVQARGCPVADPASGAQDAHPTHIFHITSNLKNKINYRRGKTTAKGPLTCRCARSSLGSLPSTQGRCGWGA